MAILAWVGNSIDDGWQLSNINVAILYVFAISSLEVYGVIMGGWASNSKYPFLGSLRSAAQMISYEVSIGFVIITVLICVGSLNLIDIVESQKNMWFAIPLLPMFVVFIISVLAETNRLPFDLPEDEATLVAGFFTEYSSISIWFIFLSGIREYDFNEFFDGHFIPRRLVPSNRYIPFKCNTWNFLVCY